MQWFRGGVPLEILLVRLDAGDDLLSKLARVAEDLNLGTTVVLSGQGLLAQARLATAGEILLETPGPLRVIGLQGTFFSGLADLTVTLARSNELIAGAVRVGCVVETTVECVLLRVGQLNPSRVPDAAGLPRLEVATRIDTTGEPITLMGQPVDLGAVALLPRSLIERYHVLPVQRVGDALVLAMADTHDLFALDDCHVATGLKMRPVAVSAEELHAAIAKVLARMQ
jgi:predicted DNA-binding protein with PD1-like motif